MGQWVTDFDFAGQLRLRYFPTAIAFCCQAAAW